MFRQAAAPASPGSRRIDPEAKAIGSHISRLARARGLTGCRPCGWAGLHALEASCQEGVHLETDLGSTGLAGESTLSRPSEGLQVRGTHPLQVLIELHRAQPSQPSIDVG